jgi:hypothetical protein
MCGKVFNKFLVTLVFIVVSWFSAITVAAAHIRNESITKQGKQIVGHQMETQPRRW